MNELNKYREEAESKSKNSTVRTQLCAFKTKERKVQTHRQSIMRREYEKKKHINLRIV